MATRGKKTSVIAKSNAGDSSGYTDIHVSGIELSAMPQKAGDVSLDAFVAASGWDGAKPTETSTDGKRIECREVRFTAGQTIYVEALQDGRWVSRYWTADGRINLSYETWSVDAFELELDNQMTPNNWELVHVAEMAKTDKGARHFVVELTNKLLPVSVKLRTLLDDTPVMIRWLEITNTSDQPTALTAVYPWTNQLASDEEYYHDPTGPKPFDHAFTLGYFAKVNHCQEGWFQWKPLPAGKTAIGCDRGQCYDDPFFIIRNEGTGNHLMGSLAWSTNWKMELECNEHHTGPLGNQHTLQFKIGPATNAALRVIDPGETIATPAVHLAFTANDLDTTVQAMHDHLRRFVLPSRNLERSYRVQYALPGSMGYTATSFGNPAGCTEESIKENVDIAEALGAELFIMDADWWDQQGDWDTTSPTRLPNGLGPIVDYVHGKGMLFGLYGEIERAYGANCKIAREHPDWIDWYPPYCNLNMARPEVAAHAEKELIGMIERYKLDLYRLDFNNPTNVPCEGIPTMRGNVAECNFWRYYDAVNSMFDRIHKKFPDLMLQQCACGGGRNDLGIAARFHEEYLTDGLRLPHAIQSFSGQTLSLPPECMIIALEADGGHGIGSAANFDTNLRVVFSLSTPWIYSGLAAPNLKELSKQRRERFLHYSTLYKEFIRPILPTCRTFHHAPVNAHGGVDSGGWFAMEFAAPDRTKGWATIVRIGASESDIYVLRPRGIDRGKTYKVTFDSTGETVVIDGWRLCEGFSIRLENLISSELVMFEAR